MASLNELGVMFPISCRTVCPDLQLVILVSFPGLAPGGDRHLGDLWEGTSSASVPEGGQAFPLALPCCAHGHSEQRRPVRLPLALLPGYRREPSRRRRPGHRLARRRRDPRG